MMHSLWGGVCGVILRSTRDLSLMNIAHGDLPPNAHSDAS